MSTKKQQADVGSEAAASGACGPIRWLAKKAARKSLALGAWACGGLGIGLGAENSPRVRVLTYHRCARGARDPFCVLPEMFDAQMRLLAEGGLAISLADLGAFLSGQKQLPDGAVLVTADDGCRSVLSEMLPVWRRYRVPAVVYVNPGLIEPKKGTRLNDLAGFREKGDRHHLCEAGHRPEVGRGPFRQMVPVTFLAPGSTPPEPLMTWDELAELVEAGIAIGSHGLTHRSLGRMSEEEAREEAAGSRQLIEQRLGVEVRSFAYPFGTRADFTPATARLLAEAGYTTAMTSQHGAITPESPALKLPRIKVEGGEGLWMFRLLCRGGLDGWRVVDRNLWRLQAAGR